MGDEFYAVFTEAPDALDAALAAQQSLRSTQRSAEPAAAELVLKVRMAVHTGPVQLNEGNYYNPAVVRLVRLLGLAHGGQVLLSGATRELIRNDLPPGASLKDLGLHRLRNLQVPEQVYQLVHPDLPSDFPPLRRLSDLPPPGRLPEIPADLSRDELLHLLFEIYRRLEAQKKSAAFLSVDVVESSAMKRAGTSLTAEYTFGQFQRWIDQVVQQCAGETYTPAGDGVMCRFGSDAEALRAARRLQQELARFNEEHNRLPQPFRIRCGVSAGEIAFEAGSPISGLRSAIIDRAAALQKRAAPGGILVSGEVAAAALMELGPLTPLAEPIAGEPAFEWTGNP
jgi:class 3 adenylate cyclase